MPNPPNQKLQTEMSPRPGRVPCPREGGHATLWWTRPLMLCAQNVRAAQSWSKVARYSMFFIKTENFYFFYVTSLDLKSWRRTGKNVFDTQSPAVLQGAVSCVSYLLRALGPPSLGRPGDCGPCTPPDPLPLHRAPCVTIRQLRGGVKGSPSLTARTLPKILFPSPHVTFSMRNTLR